tara:strand:- start:1975 stop:3123 length:1149 start_codon:yes stop_codon:yes gene_type:complete
MAVVSVKTLHDGWSGTFSGKGTPSFNVVYLVEVDNPQDGNNFVVDAVGIPQFGDAYSVGNDIQIAARCKSLSTSPVSGTRNLWQVTAQFGVPEQEKDEDDPAEGVTQDGKETDDPLKFAVSMSTSTSRVSRDAILGTYVGQLREAEGIAGKLETGNDAEFMDGMPQIHLGVSTDWTQKQITNGRPITNSVFRPFDPPPQVEYNRQNISIKFNTLNNPHELEKYINSVNSTGLRMVVNYKWGDEFGDDRAVSHKVDVPAYAGRILGLQTSPAMIGGIGYHENVLEIEVDRLYTWRLDILDRGYATTNKEKSSRYEKGVGMVVTDTPASNDGFANREPVLLDGHGEQLLEAENNAVYLRYGIYPELDWKVIGLQQPRRLQDLGQ